MGGMGLVLGFVTGLLPQLREPDSIIQIDDSSASWIASIPGFAVIVGNFIVPMLMSRLGRRPANLCSLVVSAAGWLCIVLSNTVSVLYLARFLQGTGMGMITALGPVLVGEYTSPKNRGLFLMSISVTMSIAIFVIQTLGSYFYWKTCALVCIGIVLFNMIIVIFSPESPTFLADKERYDECRKVFTYLRGDSENVELENMIAARMAAKKEQTDENKTIRQKILAKSNYLKEAVKKKEFYKPIFIMFHVYAMAQWCGINVITSFTTDLFERVVGVDSGVNIPLMIIIVGALRIFENLLGMVFIKTLKRRVMLFSTIGLNVVALLAIAAYTFSSQKDLVADSPVIGIVLIHILMFTIATGAIPISYVLAGELFPREYKGLCGGISMLFFSMNLFANTKTVLFFLGSWDIYGTFCLYAGVVLYCLVVVGIFLPETKDRTLQDIEEEFRGKRTSSE
ncbi:facilitated trehalose transporter Tret1-like isoform X2 [Plodia interpunctella]|nr:facilitated trehalose transporter Tret1-like isoform X2 [Plodia interpunctella]XP_053618685.1 facilitated trehalose transporter Tret1-like isoform X2 [Plodia interpunctella]